MEKGLKKLMFSKRFMIRWVERLMILRKLYPLLIFILIASPNTLFAQEKDAKKVIKIGVIQSFSHPNVDADIKGFEKALTRLDSREGVHTRLS